MRLAVVAVLVLVAVVGAAAATWSDEDDVRWWQTTRGTWIPCIPCLPTPFDVRTRVQPVALALHNDPRRAVVDFVALDWRSAPHAADAAAARADVDLVLGMLRAESRDRGGRWIVRLPHWLPADALGDLDTIQPWLNASDAGDGSSAVWFEDADDDASLVRRRPPLSPLDHRPVAAWCLFLVATRLNATMRLASSIHGGGGGDGGGDDSATASWTPMVAAAWSSGSSSSSQWLQEPAALDWTPATRDTPWPAEASTAPDSWPRGYRVWAAWLDAEFLPLDGAHLYVQLGDVDGAGGDDGGGGGGSAAPLAVVYELTAGHVHVLARAHVRATPILPSLLA